MKNIAIFGVARSGKTTLARMIKQRFTNYNIIDGDCIRSTFESVLPSNNINHLGGEGMVEDFPKFCGQLLAYQIKEHKKIFNFIFESCDVEPYQSKEYFNIEDTLVIFLGYPSLTLEEVINNYTEYAEPNDYMMKKTPSEILNRATMWLEKSKTLRNECEIYNIRFIDVSYNRNEIFKDLLEELANEEK